MCLCVWPFITRSTRMARSGRVTQTGHFPRRERVSHPPAPAPRPIPPLTDHSLVVYIYIVVYTTSSSQLYYWASDHQETIFGRTVEVRYRAHPHDMLFRVWRGHSKGPASPFIVVLVSNFHELWFYEERSPIRNWPLIIIITDYYMYFAGAYHYVILTEDAESGGFSFGAG